MRIPFISTWLEERRFNREHRPYLEVRRMEPGPFDGFWCRKHDCWFGKCPV